MSTSQLGALTGSARLQLAILRRVPSTLFALVTAPLLTVSFLAVVTYTGRTDLEAYAVLAPAMMAVLTMALYESGELIFIDRENGVFEALIATPASVGTVVFGRICAISMVSLVAIVESWLVAWLGFGVVVTVSHPVVFAVTLLAVSLATSGLSVLMAATFVVGRSVRSFQNSLTYPLFLLGGVMVPTTMLPEVLQPVSRALYMSWATDLLRDSLIPAAVHDVVVRLAMVLILGGLCLAAGVFLLNRLLKRVRRTGEVSYT